jgi:hypothetical protein
MSENTGTHAARPEVDFTPTQDAITVYTSVDGNPINKIVSRLPDGSVKKGMVEHRQDYWAEHRAVHDLDALADLVREVGERPDAMFSLVTFNDPPVERWQTRAADRLAAAVGLAADNPDLAQWHPLGNVLVAPRIKAMMRHAPVLGFDFDDDPDAPGWLAGLELEDRFRAVDLLLPGFAGCGKVIKPSTTTRVTVDGAPLGASSHHVFVLVSDPDLIEVKWRQAMMRALITTFEPSPWDDATPMFFPKARHSRKDPSVVVGMDWRTVADRCTGHVNRLWFVGAPVVEGAGLAVLPPVVEVIDGPPLDLSRVRDLTKEEWEAACDAIRRMKGVRPQVRVRRLGTKGRHSPVVGVSITVRDLDPGLEIDTEDGWTTFGEWAAGRAPHTRCQSPFRDSDSEAAFLGRHADGEPFLFDSGTGEKHMLRLDRLPTLAEMLEDWIVDYYEPEHGDRRGGAFHSRRRQSWISLKDVQIPTATFAWLRWAGDAPRLEKGEGPVNMTALRSQARLDIRHAFASVIDALPLNATGDMGDLIRALLKHQVPGAACSWWRRAAASWAHHAAHLKPDHWQQFGDLDIACIIHTDGAYQFAIKQGLAKQLSTHTHGELAGMTPTAFAQRCGEAGIRDGKTQAISIDGGQEGRWVVLTIEFSMSLDLNLNHDTPSQQETNAIAQQLQEKAGPHLRQVKTGPGSFFTRPN